MPQLNKFSFLLRGFQNKANKSQGKHQSRMLGIDFRTKINRVDASYLLSFLILFRSFEESLGPDCILLASLSSSAGSIESRMAGIAFTSSSVLISKLASFHMIFSLVITTDMSPPGGHPACLSWSPFTGNLGISHCLNCSATSASPL